MNASHQSPRLPWRCAAGLLLLALLPAVACAGSLWDTPVGPDAQDETPPPAFDRDAGERRRVTAPVASTTPRVVMWYNAKPVAHYVRQGRVLQAPVGSALADFKPTPVTLDIADKPPQAALETFGKAAGLTVRGRDAYFLRDAGLPNVTLQTKDTPLLEALLEVCSQTGTLPSEIIPKRVTLAPAEAETAVGTWCVCGPFAIVLQRIENVADFSNGQGSGSSSSGNMSLPVGPRGARLSMLMVAEPGISVAKFPGEFEIDTFVDDLDQKIELGAEPRSPFAGSRAVSTALRQWTLPLTLPARPGRSILLLKGSIPLLLARQAAHIAEDPPAQAVSRQAGGMTVEIQPLVKNGTNNYNVTVRISKGELTADAWDRASRTLDDLRITVEDLGGQAMTLSPRPVQRQGDDSVLLTGSVYARDANATPGKIVLDIPTELLEVKVPFEFKNLVLP